MQILLVEPDPNNAVAVGDNLVSSMDAKVFLALSRRDALTMVETGNAPDVALVAWDERHVLWSRLVRALREHQPNLPVVVMLPEGLEPPESIVDGLNLQGILSKPAPPGDLSRVLMEAAKRAFEIGVAEEFAPDSLDEDMPGWLRTISQRLRKHEVPSIPLPSSIRPAEPGDMPIWLPPEFASGPGWLPPDTNSPLTDQRQQIETEIDSDDFKQATMSTVDVDQVAHIDWKQGVTKPSTSVVRSIIKFFERAPATVSEMESELFDDFGSRNLGEEAVFSELETAEPPEVSSAEPSLQLEAPDVASSLYERVVQAREFRGVADDQLYSSDLETIPSAIGTQRAGPAIVFNEAYRLLAIRVLLLVAGLLIGGTVLARFVPSFVNPEVRAEPVTRAYRGDALGISMGLPEGWRVEEAGVPESILPDAQLILSAENREGINVLRSAIMDDTFAVGEPVFVGIVSSQDELSDLDPRDLADVLVSEQLILDLQRRSTRTVPVGATFGIQTDFSGTDAVSGDTIRGSMVAVTWFEQAGFMIGAAPAREWRGFAPTFDAIVASVELFEPEEPDAAPAVPGEFTGGDGRETSAVWRLEVNGAEQFWQMEAGNYAHNWMFESGEDWAVTITVRALEEAYDPFLTLIGPDGEVLARDDDSGVGQWNRDAQLRATLSQGEYVVRVNSFGEDGEGGAYAISVTTQ